MSKYITKKPLYIIQIYPSETFIYCPNISHRNFYILSKYITQKPLYIVQIYPSETFSQTASICIFPLTGRRRFGAKESNSKITGVF
jgi:hypothetical protein